MWQIWFKTQPPPTHPHSCGTSGKLYAKSSFRFHILKMEGIISENKMYWISWVPCMPCMGNSKSFRTFCSLFWASWDQGSCQTDLGTHWLAHGWHTIFCWQNKWIVCNCHLTLNQNVGCVLGRPKERQKIWFFVQLTFLTLLTFIVTFWLYKAWNSPFPYPPNLETNSSKSKTGPIQTGSSYTRVGKSAPKQMQIHGTQDLAHRSLGRGKVWEAWLSPAHPSALSWDITSSPKLIGPPKLDSAPFVCLLVVWTQPYHCTYHSRWLCSTTRTARMMAWPYLPVFLPYPTVLGRWQLLSILLGMNEWIYQESDQKCFLSTHFPSV